MAIKQQLTTLRMLDAQYASGEDDASTARKLSAARSALQDSVERWCKQVNVERRTPAPPLAALSSDRLSERHATKTSRGASMFARVHELVPRHSEHSSKMSASYGRATKVRTNRMEIWTS